MSADERLKRLKDLVHRLEQLPASPERDRLLADARGRVVDVDTGEKPEPLREAEPPLSAIAQAARRVADPPPPPPAAPRPAAPPRAVPRSAAEGAPTAPPPAKPPQPAEASDWGALGDRLSLDDDDVADRSDEDPPGSWRLGLRG